MKTNTNLGPPLPYLESHGSCSISPVDGMVVSILEDPREYCYNDVCAKAEFDVCAKAEFDVSIRERDRSLRGKSWSKHSGINFWCLSEHEATRTGSCRR
jgi:hypothetical protein